MTEEHSQENSKRAPSVPRNEAQIDTTPAKGFTVKASPFNPVKLELGYLLVVAILLMLIIHRVTDSRGIQILVLMTYSSTAMGWLIYRIRGVVRQQQQGKE